MTPPPPAGPDPQFAAAQGAYEAASQTLLDLCTRRSRADDRVAAFRAWHAAGMSLFNCYDEAVAADSLTEADRAPAWYTHRAETAVNLLEVVLNHFATLRDRAAHLKLDPGLFRPSPTAFAGLQRLVADTHPALAAGLRDRFLVAGLPTHGFDTPMASKGAAGGTFPLWERILLWVATLGFLVVVGYLAVRDRPFADPNQVVIVRTVLSVCAATLTAVVPGFLDVRLSWAGKSVRAGGALAVLVLTYFFTPGVIPVAGPRPDPAAEVIDVGFLDYGDDARAPRLDIKLANRGERPAFVRGVSIDVKRVWPVPAWPGGVGVVVPPSHNYVAELRPVAPPYRVGVPVAHGLKPDEFDRFTVQLQEAGWASGSAIYLADVEVEADGAGPFRKADLMFLVTQGAAEFPTEAGVREIVRGQAQLGVQVNADELRRTIAAAREVVLGCSAVPATRSRSLQHFIDAARNTASGQPR